MKENRKKSLRFTLATVLLVTSLFVPAFHNWFDDGKAYAAEMDRMAGTNRYETAVSISKAGWQDAENIVLANGLNFPDALSGAPLSYALDAPILLVKKDAIPQSTLDEISRLAPKTIYLLGSTGVISDTLATQLKGKGYTIIRVAGSSRYTTATAIGEEMRKTNSQNTAVLVYGRNYPDALGIGGVASENGWPILFTNSNSLHNDTKQSLAEWGIEKVLVVGGTGVIKDAIAKEMTDMGISVERLSGADRIATSIKVAEKFYPSAEQVMISTGYNFPDALAGGPLAGKQGSPMLLVRPNRVSQGVLEYLEAAKANQVTILGGEGAVEERVIDEISSLYDGNSVDNILGGGIVATEGDWIYSIQFDSIYKSKPDGTHQTKITDDLAEYLNVTGDWLYYSNISDGRKIYKIKTDGTGKTKLTEHGGSNVHVVNDWIYFINHHVTDMGVYKVKNDGTGLTKITDGYVFQLNVVNGWIYFDKTKNHERILYKVKTDGTDLMTIATGENYSLNVVGDWIYFNDLYNNVYKMNTNGQNKTKLATGKAAGVNVAGSWIYFINAEDNRKIYRMKTDGTNVQKVNNDVWSRQVNIAGDWVYYIVSVTEGEHLYRIKSDGTQKELIAKNLSY